MISDAKSSQEAATYRELQNAPNRQDSSPALRVDKSKVLLAKITKTETDKLSADVVADFANRICVESHMKSLCDLGWQHQLWRIFVESKNPEIQGYALFGFSEPLLNPTCAQIILKQYPVFDQMLEILSDKARSSTAQIFAETCLHNASSYGCPEHFIVWLRGRYQELMPILVKRIDVTKTIKYSLPSGQKVGLINTKNKALTSLAILFFVWQVEPRLCEPVFDPDLSLKSRLAAGSMRFKNLFFKFEFDLLIYCSYK